MKFITLILALSLSTCGGQTTEPSEAQQKVINVDPVTVPTNNGLEHAYFASGCFWCVEAIFEEESTPEEWKHFIKINYDWFGRDYDG